MNVMRITWIEEQIKAMLTTVGFDESFDSERKFMPENFRK